MQKCATLINQFCFTEVILLCKSTINDNFFFFEGKMQDYIVDSL